MLTCPLHKPHTMRSLESDKTETIANVVADLCAEKAKEGFNVYPWVPGERRSNDRMLELVRMNPVHGTTLPPACLSRLSFQSASSMPAETSYLSQLASSIQVGCVG